MFIPLKIAEHFLYTANMNHSDRLTHPKKAIKKAINTRDRLFDYAFLL